MIILLQQEIQSKHLLCTYSILYELLSVYISPSLFFFFVLFRMLLLALLLVFVLPNQRLYASLSQSLSQSLSVYLPLYSSACPSLSLNIIFPVPSPSSDVVSNAELRRAQLRIEELESLLELSKGREEKLHIELQTSRNALCATELSNDEELATTKERLRFVFKETTQQRARIQELEEAHTALETAHKIQIGELEQRLEDARHQSMSVQFDAQQAQDVNTHVQQLEHKLEITQQRADSFESELQQCQQQLEQWAARGEEFNQAQNELDRNKARIQALQNELSAKQPDFDIVHSYQEELKQHRTQQTQLRALQDEVKLLRKAHESAGVLREKIATLEQQRERDTAIVESLTHIKQLYDSVVVERDYWVSTAKESFSSDVDTADRMKSALWDLRRESVTLQNKVREHDTELRIKDNNIQQHVKRIELIESDFRHARQTLDECKRQLDAKERSLKLLRRQRDTFKDLLNHGFKAKTLQATVAAAAGTGNDTGADNVATATPDAGDSGADVSMAVSSVTTVKSIPLTEHNAIVDDYMNRIRVLETASEETERSSANVDALQKEVRELKQTNHNLDKIITKTREEVLLLQSAVSKGAFDPTITKILHFKMNPAAKAKLRKDSAELVQLREEKSRLEERISIFESSTSTTASRSDGSSSSDTVMVVPAMAIEQSKKLNSMAIRIDELVKERDALQQAHDSRAKGRERLRDVFKQTLTKFRDACYRLFGYKIEMLTDDVYRLRSMYAARPTDDLRFVMKSDRLELLETPYCRELAEDVLGVLKKYNSIPVFLGTVTTELFQAQTIF
jgi:mitotic spindle assembly checkpoint protein MAD1